jgi:hypothetical protein
MTTKTAPKAHSTFSASLLSPIEVSLDALADSQSIAIGFIANPGTPTTFDFPANSALIKKLEKLFEINLCDELEFFSATGKAGELFEIPVAADQVQADRILLIGLGDATTSSIRQAGAALGRKGRGKATVISSICVSNNEQLQCNLALISGHKKLGLLRSFHNFYLLPRNQALLLMRALSLALSRGLATWFTRLPISRLRFGWQVRRRKLLKRMAWKFEFWPVKSWQNLEAYAPLVTHPQIQGRGSWKLLISPKE